MEKNKKVTHPPVNNPPHPPVKNSIPKSPIYNTEKS